MSLIYNRNNLLLWRIDESAAMLERLVSEGDRASAARLVGAERQRQHLATRAALRIVVPEGEVVYDEVGAPYIESGHAEPTKGRRGNSAEHIRAEMPRRVEHVALHDRPPFIGVSHTNGLAAVVTATDKCAVDVERMDRDVTKTRARFISTVEEQLPDSSRPDFGIAMWCAKEVLYKLAGRREIDLLRDLAITACDLTHGRLTGTIFGGEPIAMQVKTVDKWMVVWSVGCGVCGFKYPKKSRLSGKHAVDELFARGRGGVVAPLRYLVVIEPVGAKAGTDSTTAGAASGVVAVGLRTLVSVPKKLHKRAVRRNILKRRMREAVRLGSGELRAACRRNGVSVSLVLLYTTKEVLDYGAINNAVEQILAKVNSKLEKWRPH